MTAVILCGGQGTRLRPALKNLPKCLAPINDRPFLYYMLRHLQKEDFERIILCVGYMAEKVIECFGNEFRGMELLYSMETEPLGTGGAARLAAKTMLQDEKRVLLLNGDTYFPIHYVELIKHHIRARAPITAAFSEATLAGVYIAEVSFLKSLKKKKIFEENLDLPINALIYGPDHYFLDIGTPERYLRAQSEIR